jgi:hypothetical protein
LTITSAFVDSSADSNTFENIDYQKICLDICFHAPTFLPVKKWLQAMNMQVEQLIIFHVKSPFPSAYFEHVKKGEQSSV